MTKDRYVTGMHALSKFYEQYFPSYRVHSLANNVPTACFNCMFQLHASTAYKKRRPRLRVNYLPSKKSKEGNDSIIRPHSQGNGQIFEDTHLTALPKRSL